MKTTLGVISRKKNKGGWKDYIRVVHVGGPSREEKDNSMKNLLKGTREKRAHPDPQTKFKFPGLLKREKGDIGMKPALREGKESTRKKGSGLPHTAEKTPHVRESELSAGRRTSSRGASAK